MPVMSLELEDKNRLLRIEQEKRSNEPNLQLETPIFPSSRPADAINRRWYRGFGSLRDYFRVYFWWQNSYLWMQVVPEAGSDPFICSSSFAIIQGGVQYDTVYLGTRAGDSQCDDVYVPSIYWFSQWSFHAPGGANFRQNFTVHYDGGDHNHTIPIQGGGNSYEIQATVDDSSSSGCFINSIIY